MLSCQWDIGKDGRQTHILCLLSLTRKPNGSDKILNECL